MAKIAVDNSFVIGGGYDMQLLTSQSKAFNAYLRTTLSKVVGSKKAYNRTLVKPIKVADGENFQIKLITTKKTTTNLKITYTLTAPDETVAIKLENAEYTAAVDLNNDFDEIDAAIKDFEKLN